VKLSIVTATYNNADSIAATIASVRDARGPEREHWVIDNASTDGTLEQVDRCASPYVRVVSEPDRGIYHAFNKGLARATGDVVAFLSAGDRYLPGALERVADALAQDPQPAVVHGNIEVAGPRGPRVVRPRAGFLSFGGARLLHPATFMRRCVFDAVGPFDERYAICGDLDLFLRAQRRFAFQYLDAALTHFALGGVSTRRRFRATAEVLAILRRHGTGLGTLGAVALAETARNLAGTALGPVRRLRR